MGLARLATSFYFKDELGLGPAEVAALSGITLVPWTIKPLYGWISDSFPIAGYRRRPYLVLAGTFGSLAWFGMAVWANSVFTALLLMTIASAANAVGDVIIDSLVVERTQREDWAGTGSLQSLAWGSLSIGSLITAYLGGRLLELYSTRLVFGLSSCLPLLVVLAAFLVSEAPFPSSSDQFQAQAKDQILKVWSAIKQPSLFLPVLFVFIWRSMPTSESAFFFFVTNDLGFGPGFLGQLQLATGVASLVGVLIFQVYLRHIPLRKMLGWIILISAGLGLTSLILVYHLNREWGIPDRWFGISDAVILTVAAQVAFMPLLVLAARLCPPGIEATLFALLMSITNLAGVVSHELGSLLMGVLGVTETDFSSLGLLVILSGLTKFLPLMFLGWVPDQEALDSSPLSASPSDPSGDNISLQALVEEARREWQDEIDPKDNQQTACECYPIPSGQDRE